MPMNGRYANFRWLVAHVLMKAAQIFILKPIKCDCAENVSNQSILYEDIVSSAAFAIKQTLNMDFSRNSVLVVCKCRDTVEHMSSPLGEGGEN